MTGDSDSVLKQSSTSVSRLVARMALELAIVFIGVYAAFALSEYGARQEAAARRHQMQAALVREIQGITKNTRPVAASMPRYIASFDSAVKAGKRPPLRPFMEPVRVDTHMWQVTLQSGALDLFDVAMVYDLSRFYNELNAGFEQLSQLRQLSETVLIPNLGKSADEFYEPGGHLRPKYQWYSEALQNLSQLARNITTLGDSLVITLARTDSTGVTANQ